MRLTTPTKQEISKIIPPNYSTWRTIELTYQCCRWVIDNNIYGDFVECGVGPGNNLAAMAKAGRHAYGFDSFEGIPWAGEKDKEQPGIGQINEKTGILESSGVSVHTLENVIKDMDKYGIKNFHLIKGWFQETMKKHFIEEISVLRLDGDLYDSTLIPLKYLYPNLSVGGILILDDWNLEGCREAFEHYFEHSKRPEFIFEMDNVTYWQR